MNKEEKKGPTLWVVILLLLLFWPAAIIYIMYQGSKK